MSNELVVKNFSGIKINTRVVKKIVHYFISESFNGKDFNLGIFFVSPNKMAEINERFLQHKGVTDVISFDYSEFENKEEFPEDSMGTELYGEIYVCPQVAVEQSSRFKTTVGDELLRYIIHGILHIEGYDDLDKEDRRQMRRKENQSLMKIKSVFELDDLIVVNKCI